MLSGFSVTCAHTCLTRNSRSACTGVLPALNSGCLLLGHAFDPKNVNLDFESAIFGDARAELGKSSS